MQALKTRLMDWLYERLFKPLLARAQIEELLRRERRMSAYFPRPAKDGVDGVVAVDGETPRVTARSRKTTSVKKCTYPNCNKKLDWTNFTIDHIISFAKGGKTSTENAAIMCKEHNSKKGAR